MFGQPTGGQPASTFLFGQPVGQPAAQQVANAFSFGAGAGAQQPKTDFSFGVQSPASTDPAAGLQNTTRDAGSPAIAGKGVGSGQGASAGGPLKGRLERVEGGAEPKVGKGKAWQRSPPAGTQAAQAASDDDAARKAARLARFQAANPSPTQEVPRSRSPGPSSSLQRNTQTLGSTYSAYTQQQEDNGTGFGAEDEETMEADGFIQAASPPLPAYGGGGGGYGDGDEDGSPDGLIIVGTCQLMCPEAERRQREPAGSLHPLELEDPNDNKRTREDLIVKRAVRNYDDHDLHPSKFRTLPALVLTMDHLVRVMGWTQADHPSATPLLVYDFLWDRFREVRREVKTQRFDVTPSSMLLTLGWNEIICRWLLICGHDLVEEPKFEAQLSQEQMNKVLMDLKVLYERAEGMGVSCPSSAEFKCYLAIMTYGGLVNKHRNKIPNRHAALELLRSFTAYERQSPWYHVMKAVLATLGKKDMLGFWRLAMAAPYVLACVLYTQFGMVQAQGLALAAKAYDSSTDPNNLVPEEAVKPFVSLGPMAIRSKARNLGAEVVGQELRFPYLNADEHRPNVVGARKMRAPWITKKHEGPRQDAAAQPPELPTAFLEVVAAINSVSTADSKAAVVAMQAAAAEAARAAAAQPVAVTVPARASLRPAMQAQPVRTATVFGITPQVQKPVHSPAAAPVTFGLSPQFGREAAAAGPAGAGAAAGAGWGQQQQAAASDPVQAPAFMQQQVQAPAQVADVGQQQVWAQQQQQQQQQLAAEASRELAAATEKAQRAQAEAEAARLDQQRVMMQGQMLEQRYMEAEHVGRAALHEAGQLRQQLMQRTAELQVIAAEAEAARKALAKRKLKDLAQQLTAALHERLQRRALQQWRAALQLYKEREERIREQMSRCRVNLVARGHASPRGLAEPVSGSGAGGGFVDGQAASKRPCRRLSGPDARFAAAAVAPPRAPTPALRLPDLLLPVLQRTMRAAGWTADNAASAGRGNGAGGGAQPDLAIWKLVVCSGLQPAGPGQPLPSLSPAHQRAGEWLRQRLSGGRQGTAYQPPSGCILSLLLPNPSPSGFPDSVTSTTQRIAICVEDLNAAAVAAEPALLPEHSSPSMGATSAILLLVDGPAQDWSAAGGRQLPAELQASLSRSWEQLQQLLKRLAPQVKVPVVMLSLTGRAGVDSVKAHFQQSAARWPAGVVSRLSRCTLLALRDPAYQEDEVLVRALGEELAPHAPAPFLVSAGCPDNTPASGPNSPRWAAAQSAAASLAAACISGPPCWLVVERLVQQLLEQCLEEHLPAPPKPGGEAQGAPEHHAGQANVVGAFNASLEALARGIHATATSTLASWGLPARELIGSGDPDASPPACWQSARVQQAADAVLAARVPYASLTLLQPVGGGPSVEGAVAAFQQVAMLLRTACEEWLAAQHAKGGPPRCLLLPRYRPGAVARALGAARLRPADRPFSWVEPHTDARVATQVAHTLDTEPLRLMSSYSGSRSATQTPTRTLYPPIHSTEAGPDEQQQQQQTQHHHQQQAGAAGPAEIAYTVQPLLFGGVRPAPPTPHTGQLPAASSALFASPQVQPPSWAQDTASARAGSYTQGPERGGERERMSMDELLGWSQRPSPFTRQYTSPYACAVSEEDPVNAAAERVLSAINAAIEQK